MDAIRERVGTLTDALLARDGWSRDQLVAHQEERLRALLDHAAAHSPYYRRMLGTKSADRPLADLPTLSKTALMANFDQIVCDPRLRRAELEAHLAGPEPERSFLGTYRVLTTSGTTGLRGVFALTEDEAAVWIAATLRAGVRAGIAPDARLAQIGTPSRVHLTRQLFAPVQGAAGGPDVSAATPVPELVAALNAYQPEAMVGYPSIAGVLAEEQLAGRLHIRLTAGAFGAEPLTPGLRRRIRAAWGFEPVSMYAATEAPVIASSTPEHTELEIAEDLVLVEVVDRDDEAVPPGTPGSKVLITNLVNHAQPLIRYELTDAVTLADGPNPAGRPYRCLAAVDGRSADTLHLPARGGGKTAVHPSALGAAVAHVTAVRQYQFLLDERGLHARVVLAPDAPDGIAADLRRALIRAIEVTGAVVPDVDVEQASALRREPSGKIRLVTVR
jgi:phenylacetate-CoA ligase